MSNNIAIAEHRDHDERGNAYGGVYHVHAGRAGNASLLGVLSAVGVKLRFSFSSALAEVEPTLGRRNGVLAGTEGAVPILDTLDTEARRIPDGVPDMEGRELEDLPSADCTLTGGVGVVDSRDALGGGGPILLEVLLVGPVTLERMLLFKALILARGPPEGVPVSFRSEPSLDTSERDEGGRGVVDGVVKVEDARRQRGFEVEAGVAVELRTPRRRFT